MNDVTKSRFSSFVGKAVQSGSKVQGSMNPTLIATSTKDKFTLNDRAMALLGVDVGGHVVLIDMNKGGVDTEDENERFYPTKGWEKADGSIAGAKIGKGGGFSYSGVYSAILINNPEVPVANVADMVKAGVAILKEENNAFVAKKKVHFEVEALEGENGETTFPVAEGVEQEVFSLVGRVENAHNPKEVGTSDEPVATDLDAEPAE